jgi:hypothetical protein
MGSFDDKRGGFMLICRSSRTWYQDYSFITYGMARTVVSEPTIIQTSSYKNTSPAISPVLTDTIPLTLSSMPKEDSILLVFLGINQFTMARTPTAPDATWNSIHNAAYLQAGLFSYWKRVDIGDDKSYTFLISGTNEYHSGIIYEIAGCDIISPIHKQSIVTFASSLNPSTNTVTPSILGTLPISAVTTVNGTQTTYTLNSVSSGWTVDERASSTWEASYSAHGSLTTDISTGISNTFNFNAATMGAVASIILLTPA